MKSTIKVLAAVALSALAVGCASALKEKENLAIAAGFKVITPVTPEQVALLPKLPEGKVTQVNRDGKTYYVLPDVKNNQAYVGGPAEYQAYQKLRIEKQISNENLQAAQMNQMAAAQNWAAWGGWGGYGWGGMGAPMVGPRMGPVGYYR